MTTDDPKSVDEALDALLAPIVKEGGFVKGVRNLLIPKWRSIAGAILALGVIALVILYTWSWRAPSVFPANSTFTVRGGTTLQENGVLLSEKGLIRSVFWFKAWSTVLGGSGGVKAGNYIFERPAGVIGVASRLSRGSLGQTPIRVTIPEGTSVAQIANILEKKLPTFDTESFLSAAEGKEGYLFPDTYSLPPSIDSNEIVKVMNDGYARKISDITDEIAQFGKSIEEVMTMASLLEEEARTTDTRRRIAGILWKRLEIGMPLQVDAVFPYIIGKNTFEVTIEDLKVDSPYNTYKYRGLPPGPITNPGLDSILAAITPIESKYLYYLSDKSGEMHYAVSHAKHLVNKEKYLR